MRKKFARALPSPAMVVALTALFVALGSSAYAAFSLPKNSVGNKQLKNGAVTTKKIKNGAVTASKINTSGLTVPTAVHANTAGSAAPSGPAAGSLTGSYPDPTIGPEAVSPAMIGPVPAAVVTNTSDTSVPASSQVLLTFDTPEVNIDGVYSSTGDTSRLTAPIDGLYEVHGQVNWTTCNVTASSPGYEEVEIFENAATRIGVTSIPISASACVAEGVSRLVHLHAGDFVQLYVRQDSNGASPEVVSGTALQHTDDTPEFDMRWVAPS